ncbi:Ferritin heavy polypeptide-like 17 [Lemmus lemmus]
MVNNHVQVQLHASYLYLSIALLFDRDDVALENFKHFFLSKSHSCKASAQMFLFLPNKCGGLVFFPSISTPECDSWHGSLQAMEFAFQMEMTINQSLQNLHKLANEKGAADLCYFLELHCLNEQAHVLHKMSGYLANLCQMGFPENSFANYTFDELVQS